MHIAALGRIWQALVFGFLGMHPEGERLRFVPHTPRQWGALRMPIQRRDNHLLVKATPHNNGHGRA